MLLSFFVVGAFAYTPSSDFQERLELVAEKMDEILDERWDSVRESFLGVIEDYKSKYVWDEKSLYILNYLSNYLGGEPSMDNTNNSVTLESNYMGSYTINDSSYGTDVEVSISWRERIIEVNALPNHSTWSFPNSWNPNSISAQSITYEFPAEWNYTGDETWARIPGVAINGVKFEPETAERVECSSGETYKIEAVQDMTDLGLDFNNAHVQPTGEYHYHGHSDMLVEAFDHGNDLVHIGFASDGFLMYYSKSGAYKPSYVLVDELRDGTSCSYRNKTVSIDNTSPDGTYVSDWEFVDWSWDLDACNGTYIDGEYIYLITDEYPYIGRCLNGEYSERWPGGFGPPPR